MAARGTSARTAGIEPHGRPGWYVGLEAFERFERPVELEAIRTRTEAIASGLTALRQDVGDPLYFPFEVSSSRPIRPMQGYLFAAKGLQAKPRQTLVDGPS